MTGWRDAECLVSMWVRLTGALGVVTNRLWTRTIALFKSINLLENNTGSACPFVL